MTAYLLPPMSAPYPLVVTQRFGVPGPLPPHGKHTGIDLQAAIGHPIVSPGAGRVVHFFRAGMGDGPAADGNAVCVQLDRLTPEGRAVRCWWLHLSRSLVIVGQLVSAREVLGATGDTGEVTGPHLHFQLEELNGNLWIPIDPAPAFLPVALLA